LIRSRHALRSVRFPPALADHHRASSERHIRGWDRVTVLKRGRNVGERTITETTEKEALELIQWILACAEMTKPPISLCHACLTKREPACWSSHQTSSAGSKVAE
jgi:hypothetical protein